MAGVIQNLKAQEVPFRLSEGHFLFSCDTVIIRLDKENGCYSGYNGMLQSILFTSFLLMFSSFTIDHIPLPPTAGVGMAGQQRQQVAARLDFDLVHLVGLDDLNVSHCVSQRFP